MRKTFVVIPLLGALALVSASVPTMAAEGARKPVFPTVVEYGEIARTSKRTNRHGNNIPPWTSAQIFVDGFKVRLKAGVDVTVVPLAAGVQPFALKVRSVKAVERCGGEAKVWQPKLPAVRRADLLAHKVADGHQFDALVLYPTRKRARFVSPKRLPKSAIPKGFRRHNLMGGVDLNGDRRADLLFVAFCVKAHERHMKPGPKCEYIGSSIYKRRGRRWVVHKDYLPC